MAGVTVELYGVEIWGKLLGAEVESPALDACHEGHQEIERRLLQVPVIINLYTDSFGYSCWRKASLMITSR